MSFRTRGPGPPSCPGGPRGLSGGLRGAGRRHQWIGAIGDLLTPLWTTLCALLLLAATAAGEGNKKYQMESLCGDSFRQLQLRKIDGAELRSQNERNLNCIVTFQTHSILQSFMLRFEELHLDCNDHLYIYDGAHDAGTAKWDLSCRDTRELVGPIHTRTNHVTLKYVTDNWGTERCGFNLIITAVKDPQATCNDFKCKTREFCIHTDLLCDGVNHCADGSDETVSEKCGRGDIGQVLGMSITFLVVATVSALLILGAAVVAIGVCMYRQSPSANTVRASQQPMLGTTNPFQPVVVHSGLNGAGHAMHEPGTTTLSRGPRGPMNPPHTLSLMQPGNWLCPVGTQLGYSTVPARLYCCLVN